MAGDEFGPPHRLARPGLGRLVLGLILTVSAGFALLVIIGRMIYAALGPASADPHGYLSVFGGVAGLVLSIPLIIGLVLVVAGVRVRRGAGQRRLH